MNSRSQRRQRLHSSRAEFSGKTISTSRKFFTLSGGVSDGFTARVAALVSVSATSAGSMKTVGSFGAAGSSSGSLRRYRSMLCAAFFPAAIASITVFGPVTRSPPAKTPRRLVSRVLASAFIRPPPCRDPSRSGRWPRRRFFGARHPAHIKICSLLLGAG